MLVEFISTRRRKERIEKILKHQAKDNSFESMIYHAYSIFIFYVLLEQEFVEMMDEFRR